MRDSLGIIRTRRRRIWSIPSGDKARLMKFRLPGWAIFCVIVGSFLLSGLFEHFGRLELGIPTLASVFVLCLVVVLKWRLRVHIWFWVTIAFFVALHVVLLVTVPWTTKWVPAFTTAGICSIDTYAMLYAISIIGRLRHSDV
jgi:hypothetical protein